MPSSNKIYCRKEVLVPAETPKEKLVLKIGGSSIPDEQAYTALAKKLIATKGSYEGPLVIVISAMKGETDRLWKEAEEIHTDKWWQVQYVADAGEFNSAHAMKIALEEEGAVSKVVTASDIKMTAAGTDPENCELTGTDQELFDAYVKNADSDFVVIPGYVAAHEKQKDKGQPLWAALGRNSTDLIAVEVAKCLDAPLYFVKSAPTVYAVSPELVENPKEIPHMTYEQALRFLEYLPQGDQFIMRKAVEYAWKKKVELIFGSLNGETETKISASPNGESGSGFIAMPVKENIALVQVKVPASNNVRAEIFRELHKKGIRFSDKTEGRYDPFLRTYSFFIDDSQKEALADAVKKFAVDDLTNIQNAALITLIDMNLDPESHHSSIESEAFEIKDDDSDEVREIKEDIEILHTQTSGVIMHIYMGRRNMRHAVKLLADKFELSKNAD